MLQDDWLVFHVFWIVSTYWHVVKLSRSCRSDDAEVLKVKEELVWRLYHYCNCLFLYEHSAYSIVYVLSVSSCLFLLPLLGSEHAFYAPKAVSNLTKQFVF